MFISSGVNKAFGSPITIKFADLIFSNLNDFLKDYGITFRGDSVVRTSYYKYFHPKQCYIDTLTVHPGFLKTIKNIKKMKKIDLMDDDNDMDDNDDDDCPLNQFFSFFLYFLLFLKI